MESLDGSIDVQEKEKRTQRPAIESRRSSSAIERVFPIRIQHHLQRQPSATSSRLQSTTSSSSQQIQPGSTDEAKPAPIDEEVQDEEAPPVEESDALINPNVSAPLVSQIQVPSGDDRPVNRYITHKFSYLPDQEGAKRPPKSSDVQTRRIYRCEDEPIHIPGAIQKFGALIALREDEAGHLLVRIVSENSADVVGLTSESLFQLECFTDVLTDGDEKEFLSRIEMLRSNPLGTTPDVFAITITSKTSTPIPLFCATHLSKEADLIICEFEVAREIFRPKHPPDDGFPEEPINKLEQGDIDPIQQLASTTSKSEPLRSVDLARKTSRPLGSMELFQVLSEIQNQMAQATVLSELLDVIVGIVQELTSFHRVMIYQFDETAAGSVKSEIIDRRASTDLYHGLHFPAGDIPSQARALYRLNTIRILYDRDEETARLICRELEDVQTPLDLKHSYLRSMSPIHLKYLTNMGVMATMSISLIVHGHLWGLISCHNYGYGSKIALPLRELCRGIGQIASSNIERVIYAGRIQARRVLSRTPPKISPSAYIAASSSDLLGMFEADLGFLVIKGEARTIGKLFCYSECIELLNYVRQQEPTTIFSSNSVKRDCPDVDFELSVINGLLIIPLAHSGADFLIFLRKSQQDSIQWAGNPYENKTVGTENYLEPRSSFKRWSENVVGTSKEWTEDQIESASVLSTLYGRFIEVWRQKEAIVQRNRMTRVLIRNAGHEVRTPLNSIINYLEMALEETLDEGARHHLQRSLEASKSLVFVVNDLLKLTQVEDVEFHTHEENVELTSLISEAIFAFKDEATRRNVTLEANYGTPRTVRCDPAMSRQVIFNLLANAVRNSDGGTITISLVHISTIESIKMIEISIQDEGVGLSESELDSLFQDFEKVLDDDETHPKDPGISSQQPSTKPAEIGLGLAVTARFVRHHHGQIKVSSEGKGKGTLVSLKIPFRRAKEEKRVEISDSSNPPDSSEMILKLPFRISIPATGLDLNPITNSTSNDHGSMANSTPQDTGVVSSTVTDRHRFSRMGSGPADIAKRLNVLVAEDNPLNSRLLEARLSRKMHGVKITVDGRACLDAFVEQPDGFDIVLMDIQMPLVDGIEATRLIRDFERTSIPEVSPHVAGYGRIPIIAVSASIEEHERHKYIEAGFDGWIVKPIDFRRLERVLMAIDDKSIRDDLLYGKESWDKGGWFDVAVERR